MSKQKFGLIPPAAEEWIASVFEHCGPAASIERVRAMAIMLWELWCETEHEELRIPGYQVPPPDCGTGHPAGWTYAYFRRIRRSADFSRTPALTSSAD